jgi:hypothetical protein
MRFGDFSRVRRKFSPNSVLEEVMTIADIELPILEQLCNADPTRKSTDFQRNPLDLGLTRILKVQLLHGSSKL